MIMKGNFYYLNGGWVTSYDQRHQHREPKKQEYHPIVEYRHLDENDEWTQLSEGHTKIEGLVWGHRETYKDGKQVKDLVWNPMTTPCISPPKSHHEENKSSHPSYELPIYEL